MFNQVYPNSKVHGTNMGPTWVLSASDGPHVGPMNLAIRVYDYLTSIGLLYESQYGFRRYHSTEIAALEFMDRIRNEMDGKKVPFSVFLYLSKAFDTLDLTILLTKLHCYVIRETALNWFKSILSKRIQYVECNGTRLLTPGTPLPAVGSWTSVRPTHTHKKTTSSLRLPY